MRRGSLLRFVSEFVLWFGRAVCRIRLEYNLDTLSSSYNFAGTSVVVGFLIKLGSAPAHQ